MRDAERTIIVSGDTTVDVNLAREHTEEGHYRSAREAGMRAHFQPGGVYLLADLVEAVVRGWNEEGPDGRERPYKVRRVPPPENIGPADHRFVHSYALWSLYPREAGKEKKEDPRTWRICKFMGYGDDREHPLKPAGYNEVQGDDEDAGLVILDDAGWGFRDSEDLWPRAIRAGGRKKPWILHKMAKPVAEGPLWANLFRHHRERLVVVMAAEDLRRTVVHVSRGLSWEQTAEDLARELRHNPQINAFSECALAVVSFGPSGAVALENAGRRRLLFFDPGVLEGEWGGTHPGRMVGYTACLVGGLVRHFLKERKWDVEQGIPAGIYAMRALHRNGWVPAGDASGKAGVSFPHGEVVKAISKPKEEVAKVEIPDVAAESAAPAGGRRGAAAKPRWTILQTRCGGDLRKVARDVVEQGPGKALAGVPLGRFGKLVTMERREIEAYRGVAGLLSEYCAQAATMRPLSVAVFGPPGAGKSFGIKQLAESLLRKVEILEFNLSQFQGPGDLIAALHQVRDAALSGMFPLVFWDEFDTALGGVALGWLRYFLAPMQDGKFQEGQIVHPIGRCLFVFAGGTSHSVEAFCAKQNEVEGRAGKVRDFVSRLKGFVEVKGPNPAGLEEAAQGGRTVPADEISKFWKGDPYCILRRAILLRSILVRDASQVVDEDGMIRIDPGVRRAFLEVPFFKHGARSMESIVAMSALSGKTQYERSSLPAEELLGLHVPAGEFLRLARRPDIRGEMLEEIAALVHERYRKQLEEEGYVPGEETDAEAKPPTSALLKPYAQLREDDKEQNRDQARSMWDRLLEIGCLPRPRRQEEKEQVFEFSKEELEFLAEAEHNRWWALKLAQGKTNPYMKPYGELDEKIKDRDRSAVQAIPEYLAKLGYVIERMPREK